MGRLEARIRCVGRGPLRWSDLPMVCNSGWGGIFVCRAYFYWVCN